jgi:hypothetical protein
VGHRASIFRAPVSPLVWFAVALAAAQALAPTGASAGEAQVAILAHGKPLDLPAALLADTGRRLEHLALGALYAELSDAPASARALEIRIQYDPLLLLELPTGQGRTLHVRELTLFTSSSASDGWPTLVASSNEETWSLAKYSGPLVLAILCGRELRPYAPAAIQPNCHLASP